MEEMAIHLTEVKIQGKLAKIRATAAAKGAKIWVELDLAVEPGISSTALQQLAHSEVLRRLELASLDSSQKRSKA